MNLHRLLKQREERGAPLRVALIGAGKFGTMYMTDSLWHWLVKQGWREITYRPDRRRYRDLPGAYVTHLVDAPVEHRERVLEAAIANATLRPIPARRGPWAHTRGR